MNAIRSLFVYCKVIFYAIGECQRNNKQVIGSSVSLSFALPVSSFGHYLSVYNCIGMQVQATAHYKSTRTTINDLGTVDWCMRRCTTAATKKINY